MKINLRNIFLVLAMMSFIVSPVFDIVSLPAQAQQKTTKTRKRKAKTSGKAKTSSKPETSADVKRRQEATQKEIKQTEEQIKENERSVKSRIVCLRQT